MVAHSKIIPGLFGRIIKWIDDVCFVIDCRDSVMICHKDYWHIRTDCGANMDGERKDNERKAD